MVIQEKLFDLWLGWERSQAKLIRKQMAIDEGTVIYLEGGYGPTLVLLHGFGADKDSWNQLASRLIDNFHLIVVDIPGFGESFSPKNRFNIESQVQRLIQFFIRKDLHNINLIGNSYGGYLSAILAKQYPAMISKCVLISPLGVQSSPLTTTFIDVVNGKWPLLLPRNESEFIQLFDTCFFNKPMIPTFFLKQIFNRNLNKNNIHQSIFFNTHIIVNGELHFSQSLEDTLTDINIPIHVMWGDNDAILAFQGMTILADLNNTNITFEGLKNVGHLPQLEIPKQLSHSIEDAVK